MYVECNDRNYNKNKNHENKCSQRYFELGAYWCRDDQFQVCAVLVPFGDIKAVEGLGTI